MLRVEQIAKFFGDFKAVNGANLTVGKGHLVAVIGPNGVGKTTLFNLITGQLQPDDGRIVFNDENIGKLAPPRDLPQGNCPLLPNCKHFSASLSVSQRAGVGSVSAKTEQQAFPSGASNGF